MLCRHRVPAFSAEGTGPRRGLPKKVSAAQLRYRNRCRSGKVTQPGPFPIVSKTSLCYIAAAAASPPARPPTASDYGRFGSGGTTGFDSAGSGAGCVGFWSEGTGVSECGAVGLVGDASGPGVSHEGIPCGTLPGAPGAAGGTAVDGSRPPVAAGDGSGESSGATGGSAGEGGLPVVRTVTMVPTVFCSPARKPSSVAAAAAVPAPRAAATARTVKAARRDRR
jgi:hypothetical protein